MLQMKYNQTIEHNHNMYNGNVLFHGQYGLAYCPAVKRIFFVRVTNSNNQPEYDWWPSVPANYEWIEQQRPALWEKKQVVAFNGMHGYSGVYMDQEDAYHHKQVRFHVDRGDYVPVVEENGLLHVRQFYNDQNGSWCNAVLLIDDSIDISSWS